MGCCTSKEKFDINNPDHVAREIYGCIKGLGTKDEKLISLITTKRTNKQMEAVVQAYTRIGEGRDILKDISGDTSFNYKEALLAMCVNDRTLDAKMVRKAMKGLGTNERLLNEVICSRTKPQLQEVIQAYRREYTRELVDDIKSETSGLFESNYQSLLVSLVTTEKQDPADEKTGITADLEVLYKAGEAKWGTDEKAFINLMCSRSRGYLHKLNLAYEAKYGKTLQAAIKSETSGDFCDALCFLCLPIEDFVCEKLYKAMKGLGTNDTTLIFTIVVFRNDYLSKAAKLFQQRYEKSLEEWVASETSGDYKKTMLSILANFLGGDAATATPAQGQAAPLKNPAAADPAAPSTSI